MTVELGVMGAGVLAIAGAWRLVVSDRASVWIAMPATLAALGAVAFVVRRPVAAAQVEPLTAAAIGAAAGAALFAATRAFVALASGWSAFERHTEEAYRRAREVTLPAALALSLIAVVGEELFWRGLFQSRLAEGGRLAGAAVTWLAFVAANLPSVSLPIVASAVVGGGVWAGLAYWSGGILASMVCHGVWTGAMLLFPPGRRQGLAA